MAGSLSLSMGFDDVALGKGQGPAQGLPDILYEKLGQWERYDAAVWNRFGG